MILNSQPSGAKGSTERTRILETPPEEVVRSVVSKPALLSRENPARQVPLQHTMSNPYEHASRLPLGDHPQGELFSGRSRTAGVLERRTKGGSLLSIRIPVTHANRDLLRSLRAAEQKAWEAAENLGARVGHAPSRI
jgi:hypothetical protein